MIGQVAKLLLALAGKKARMHQGINQVDEWKEILKEFNVLWIGVNAPLAILEQREKERSDRILGSARGQFHKVHAGITRSARCSGTVICSR